MPGETTGPAGASRGCGRVGAVGGVGGCVVFGLAGLVVCHVDVAARERPVKPKRYVAAKPTAYPVSRPPP